MDQNIPKLYYEYGKYVNEFRQFPLSVDGLKPVERRVLLSSYLIAKDKFVKSARIDGHTLGNFHPHASSYGTIVQLVNQEFLTGQGNFGADVGCESTSAAASRYTEARLSKFILDLAFKNINHVDWKLNDLGEKEAVYLPTMFPLCLLGKDYTQGIGFGYRTFIPCYELKDLQERLLWLIGKKENEPIIKPITDCIITSGDSDLKDLLTKGKAKINVKGVIKLSQRNHSASLKSWPYGRRFEAFLSKFSKELENQDISWIDLSSKETNIVFEVLKQRNKDSIFKDFVSKLKEVIKGTVSFEIITVDLNGKVELKSVDELLLETYKMFTSINKKVLTFKINKLQETINELKILEKVKPFLSKTLALKLDINQSINIISQQSKVDVEKVKYLFSKYKINKLLTTSLDAAKVLDEQNIHKSNLNDLQNFVIDQYEVL